MSWRIDDGTVEETFGLSLFFNVEGIFVSILYFIVCLLFYSLHRFSRSFQLICTLMHAHGQPTAHMTGGSNMAPLNKSLFCCAEGIFVSGLSCSLSGMLFHSLHRF